jgi:uroporphyrinogen III methyltransferase/synthase
VVGTVATLAAEVARAGVAAPGGVGVGDVVTLRERVRWFEMRPLFGRRVVVTRPRGQAGALADALEEQGAEVLLVPTIVLVPPRDTGALARAAAGASSYDWIVFTSANGVRAFFTDFDRQRLDVRSLAPARIAAIGPETAAELERRMLRPAVVAAEYRAEGLLDALGDREVRGHRILLPRAAGARPVLPDALRARGAHVDEVAAYEAVAPAASDVAGLRTALTAGTIDAIAFTSSSTVRNFVDLLGADEARRRIRAGRPAIACIGPVTAETARALGLPVDVVPREYTGAALAAALATHLAGGA